MPHAVTARDFQNPVSQDEVEAWRDRLAAVGVDLSVDRLKELVILWTGRIGNTHKALKAPFRPMMRWTGTNQGWGLFANPDTHPTRLEIRGRTATSAPWQPVYLQLDPEADWWWDVLAYRRVRGCYDAQGPSRRSHPVYRAFGQWIAGHAMAEHPELQAVEVRLLRTHTTLPGRPTDPEATPLHPQLYQRAGPP